MDDFEKRKEEFMTRYKHLIDELQVDFMSLPSFVPNDKGTWEMLIQTQVVDRAEMPVKSPFQM